MCTRAARTSSTSAIAKARLAEARANAGSVRLVPVGRDFGKELELLDGVKAGEAVIVQPPDEVVTAP